MVPIGVASHCSGLLYFSNFELPSCRIQEVLNCKAYEVAGMIGKDSYNILNKPVTKAVDEAVTLDLLRAVIDKPAQEAITGFIT